MFSSVAHWLLASFALKSAIVSVQAAKLGAAGGSEELSSKVLYSGIIGAIIVLFWLPSLQVKTLSSQAFGIAIVGTIWLGLAGLIVAQVRA